MGLFVNFHQNRNLDRAALRKNQIFVDGKTLAVREVEHGDAHRAASAVCNFSQPGVGFIANQFPIFGLGESKIG